ncbi:MAG: hypothetical protein OEW11_11155 [Nitrospirota bacterium]|nr:hypothetical protein [Nitrospirota bacterium]
MTDMTPETTETDVYCGKTCPTVHIYLPRLIDLMDASAYRLREALRALPDVDGGPLTADHIVAMAEWLEQDHAQAWPKIGTTNLFGETYTVEWASERQRECTDAMYSLVMICRALDMPIPATWLDH